MELPLAKITRKISSESVAVTNGLGRVCCGNILFIFNDILLQKIVAINRDNYLQSPKYFIVRVNWFNILFCKKIYVLIKRDKWFLFRIINFCSNRSLTRGVNLSLDMMRSLPLLRGCQLWGILLVSYRPIAVTTKCLLVATVRALSRQVSK